MKRYLLSLIVILSVFSIMSLSIYLSVCNRSSLSLAKSRRLASNFDVNSICEPSQSPIIVSNPAVITVNQASGARPGASKNATKKNGFDIEADKALKEIQDLKLQIHQARERRAQDYKKTLISNGASEEEIKTRAENEKEKFKKMEEEALEKEKKLQLQRQSIEQCRARTAESNRAEKIERMEKEKHKDSEPEEEIDYQPKSKKKAFKAKTVTSESDAPPPKKTSIIELESFKEGGKSTLKSFKKLVKESKQALKESTKKSDGKNPLKAAAKKMSLGMRMGKQILQMKRDDFKMKALPAPKSHKSSKAKMLALPKPDDD